jgi:hypothetical protein
MTDFNDHLTNDQSKFEKGIVADLNRSPVIVK